MMIKKKKKVSKRTSVNTDVVQSPRRCNQKWGEIHPSQTPEEVFAKTNECVSFHASFNLLFAVSFSHAGRFCEETPI